MWRITCRSLSHLSAIGFHSTFGIAPGPGARTVVEGGCRRIKTKDSGRPRATRPAHCSQWTRELLSNLSKVASSASMSCQRPPVPNWMCFSFASTNFFCRRAKLRHIRSMALWLIWVKVWIVLNGTLESISSRAIDCTCSECPSPLLVVVNNGCRCWGVTKHWHFLALHLSGLPSSFTVPPVRMPVGNCSCFCTRTMACVKVSRVIGFRDGWMPQVATISGFGVGGAVFGAALWITGAKEMVASPCCSFTSPCTWSSMLERDESNRDASNLLSLDEKASEMLFQGSAKL